MLAIIHQRQRVYIEDKEDCSKFVIANVEDLERTMKILASSIIETISRLEKRQSEALELMENGNEEFWDKNKLAERLGVSTRTAARILKTLANQGYLKEVQTTKPYSYSLAETGEKPKQLALLEKANEYKLFYEKELEAFLTGIVTTCQTMHVRRMASDVVQDGEKTILELMVEPEITAKNKQNPAKTDSTETIHPSSHPKWQSVQVPTEPIPSFPMHNSRELFADSERAIENKLSDPKPERLLECQICKDVGKPMFFLTLEDLKSHVKAFHGGYPDHMRSK